MKGMKGKIMKKLKAANKPIAYLNPDRILQVTDNFNFKSNFVDKFQFKSNPNSQCPPQTNPKLEKTVFVVEESQEDKENVVPSVYEEEECWVGVEFEEGPFTRPDMDSGLLFDPKLLAAFGRAVSQHLRAAEAEVKVKKQKCSFFQPEEQPDPFSEPDALLEFDLKPPPGGTDSVIFYTTTLRGIRKTFEDCQSIRFLLQSFGVVYYERDVSIHSDYREELWKVMGERVLPPRLFIRGRYIGGADKVLTLHEQGKLKALFRDIPINFRDAPCNVCCGLRFILCYNCNGSRKVFQCDDEEDINDGVWSKCLRCNENGLVVCPLC